jgi:ADP-dependent NAD(P)H-hydrate dehydratase / NAD(P)H-hydrate epimerase
MHILTAAQLKETDAATIAAEQIPSYALMERAAKAFAGWFENKFRPDKPVLIICGPGNNGGDGLAIARLLHLKKYAVKAYIFEGPYSEDFQHNLNQLPKQILLRTIRDPADVPAIPADAVVIDAIFGTGLNRPVSGLFGEVIAKINTHKGYVVAVDIPSGLYTETHTPAKGKVTEADFTVSFETPKLAFFLPQHHKFVGEWQVVPIGLNQEFICSLKTPYFFLTAELASEKRQRRDHFSHKGTFGHALLMAGGLGKMGAAVLAAKACLRSGAGLLTVYCPAVGYQIMQISVPEAMTTTDLELDFLTKLPSLEPYTTIGIGPGMGQHPETAAMLAALLITWRKPIVLDADALNLLSQHKDLYEQLPENSILTPHPKEFERLCGKARNDYDRLELLKNFCRQYRCFVVLKGRHTCIATPAGHFYFNTTGNPGMATGGSGDVLTGIITGLLAQGYDSLAACQLGVYLHGLAGDMAAAQNSQEALIASDITDKLGKAFKKLSAF